MYETKCTTIHDLFYHTVRMYGVRSEKKYFSVLYDFNSFIQKFSVLETFFSRERLIKYLHSLVLLIHYIKHVILYNFIIYYNQFFHNHYTLKLKLK